MPDQAPPEFAVPDNIAWVDGADVGLADELYLTVVPDGHTVLLKDTARLIWHVAAEGGNVLEDVAKLVSMPSDAIADDVNSFLTDLVARGLLTKMNEPASMPPRPPSPGPPRPRDARASKLRPFDRTTIDKVRRHTQQRLDQAVALTAKRLGPSQRTPAWDGDPRIALLTVNFSTTRYLKLMLLTLAEQEDLNLLERIVICDNGSQDDPEPFLTELESHVERVTVTRNSHPLSHARGMRSALKALREVEKGSDRPANILLFCDTDVVFRSPETLRALADRFKNDDGVAFVGELRRHVFPYPEAQASFLAVRRDWAERRATAPWVDHGSPAYWMQRSIWEQGGRGDDFASNRGGYILHRGRSGVVAGQEHFPSHHLRTETYNNPHYMGVPGGPAIWSEIEQRHASLIEDPEPGRVVEALAGAFTVVRNADSETGG